MKADEATHNYEGQEHLSLESEPSLRHEIPAVRLSDSGSSRVPDNALELETPVSASSQGGSRCVTTPVWALPAVLPPNRSLDMRRHWGRGRANLPRHSPQERHLSSSANH